MGDLTSHGILIARGGDAPGLLHAILSHLTRRPSDPKSSKGQPLANFICPSVTTAWVRGFGPFGGAMIRFETNADTLEAMTDPSWARHLEARLAALPLEHRVFIAVDKCPPPRRLNPFLTQRLYTCVHDYSRHPDRAADPVLQRFLAILSADPVIDIASYDKVLRPGGAVEAWRIIDKACRGDRWLDYYVACANVLSWQNPTRSSSETEDEDLIPDIMHDIRPLHASDSNEDDPAEHWKYSKESEVESALPSPSPASPRLMKYRPPHFHLFTSALEHLHLIRYGEKKGYAYLQLHAPDRPGLFAEVDQYVRAFITPHPDRPKPREITRSACRLMGGHAMIFIATPGSKRSTVSLEAGVTHLLSEGRTTEGPSSQDSSMNEQWMPHVAAMYSTDPPIASGRLDYAGYEAAKFCVGNNGPGVLASVCMAAQGSAEGEASICFLDTRQKLSVDGSHWVASFAIAWCIESSKAGSFRKHMDDFLQDIIEPGTSILWSAGRPR